MDRITLFKTLRELGLNDKINRLVQATLHNTTARVKFRGQLSESFSIKTGVSQGDGISCILFNCVLEKIIREWTRIIPENTGLRMGIKADNLRIPCLAFADDLTLLANDIQEATTQLQTLHSIGAKTGLLINIGKTEFVTNIKDAPRMMRVSDNIYIKRVKSVKYLGEWYSEDLSETVALEHRRLKLDKAYHACRKLYASKNLSMNVKLRHYNAVVRPSVLYAAECLCLTKKTPLRALEVQERKFLRRIVGPRILPDGSRWYQPNHIVI